MGVRVRDGVCVHRGVLRQPRAAHVRAHDAGADSGVDAGAGADANADAFTNTCADSGELYWWLARLRREGGRDLLRSWGWLGVRLSHRVRVHWWMLRRPRAAHVRAHDAGADTCADASADFGAHASTDGADACPDACADPGDL